MQFDCAKLRAYAGYYKDIGVLKRSASGGAASAVAEAMIRRGGAVFGAAYSDDFSQAVYCCAENMADLEKIKSSKYVVTQKKIPAGGGFVSAYELAAKLLKEGREVLFTGLGCDIGAAKKYMENHGAPVEKFYTLDLVCHGPTLPEVHRQFVQGLEKKFASKIVSFNVRDKRRSWKHKWLRVEFANGRVYEKPLGETDYGYAFNLYLKPSCFNCAFKGDHHEADLTVGDYWGIDRNHPVWNEKGVSVIFSRSEKGEALVNMIDKTQFFLCEADAGHAAACNHMFYESQTRRAAYDKFEKLLGTKGLHYAVVHTKGIVKYYSYPVRKFLMGLLGRK